MDTSLLGFNRNKALNLGMGIELMEHDLLGYRRLRGWNHHRVMYRQGDDALGP